MSNDSGMLGGLGHHALPAAFTAWSAHSAHKQVVASNASIQEYADQLGMNDQEFVGSSLVSQQYVADQSTNTVRTAAKTVAPLLTPGGLVTQIAVGFVTDPLVKGAVDAGTSAPQVEESMQALSEVNENWKKTQHVDAMSVATILSGQMNHTEIHDVKYAQGAAQASPLYPDQPERQVIESYDGQLTVQSKAVALANTLGMNVDNIGMNPTQFITDALNKFKLPPAILLVDDANMQYAVSKVTEMRIAQQAQTQQPAAASPAMQAYFGAGAQGGNVSGVPTSSSFAGGPVPVAHGQHHRGNSHE